MRYFVLFAVIALFAPLTSLAAEESAHNRLTQEEIDAGWILLFDGETDFGWQAATDCDWQVADGAISVSQGELGLLYTRSQFGDFILKVDFRSAPGTNSGIFLRSPPRPTDPAGDCYELNIADAGTSPFPTGSFVGRKAAEGSYDSTDWQSYVVTARGGQFTVELDGETVLEYTDSRPLGHGHIGLQYNQGRVEFRNIKLKPLGLQPLFNGRDLSGWRVFPDKQSEFSVTPEGELLISNGPGQLESEAAFGDFVLQIEVKTRGEGLNSGIFFRSIPGEFWQGYESQIHNVYRDGDRTQPVDCGTGGFYRRQDARKVVPDDFEWFHKTLVVSGRHMATWVNGYQVSDWTDRREPDENPRRGLRRKPGTLSLQGHDPTTDLLFRNIQATELPPRRR